VMGMLLDIVLISLITYGLLRTIVSRQKRTRTALPPQTPTL
jgi:hypothetical protein